MAIKDYSETAASNTTLEGIGVSGSDLPSSFDNAFRELMAELAKLNSGTDPIQDSMKWEAVGDATKQFKFDLSSITTATTRTVTWPDANIVWTADSATLANSTGITGDGSGNLTTTGNIELGHATDTTLSRVSAGVVAVEGNNVAMDTSSPTFAAVTTTGNIELGHATDTTLSRSAAGVLAVEGTDVVLADGSAMRYIKTTYITATDATWAFDADTTVARVFILGGGGGGGAAVATAATGVTVGSSGNGGGWTNFEIDVAALGGSPTTNITIGAAGTGGTATPTDGGNTTYNDGTTSITAQGGRAGTKAINSFSHLQARTTAANTATTGGDAPNNGQQAEPSMSGGDRSDTSAAVHVAVVGVGGGSPFGQGGAAHSTATTSGSSSLGNNGSGYGSGGSAAMRLHSASGTSAGGAGTAGLCVIVEYGDT